jgi:CMP-N-acetylneuraminic acid synthetase
MFGYQWGTILMSAGITAVVAVRSGSQRIKDKNLQKIGSKTLLERKLEVLALLKAAGFIEEIIVNSDSDLMLSIGEDYDCSIHKREEYYASSECTNSEFHKHIGEITNAEHIFLAPVCSPFISVKTHESAIKFYLENSYDSITSITEVKNHLWLDGYPLNYDLDDVPNSQDLPEIFKLNYGITIAKRDVLRGMSRVVGDNPGFILTDEVESIDIDTPFDYAVAKAIYSDNEIYNWGEFYNF